MQAMRDFSHYVRDARSRPVSHRPCGGGRQLRRMHVKDRAWAFRDSRRDAGARQSHRPPRGAGMAGGALTRPVSSTGSPSSATRPIRSRRFAPRRLRPSRRASCCAASASPPLPR